MSIEKHEKLSFISLPEEKDPAESLSAKTELLIECFVKRIEKEKSSHDELQMDAYLTQDHELQPLLDKYNQNIRRVNAVIKGIQWKIKTWKEHSGYHKELEKALECEEHGYPKLLVLEGYLHEIKTAIRQRLAVIAPDIDEESDLLKYIASGQNLLQDAVKDYLKSFAQIELVAEASSDSQFFIGKLKEQIEIMGSVLNKDILNPDKYSLNQLDNRLLEHLRLKTNLLLPQSFQPLSNEETDTLSKALFRSPQESSGLFAAFKRIGAAVRQPDQKQQLKEKIAATHHALSVIRSLPLQQMASFFPEKAKELKLQEEINTSSDEVREKLKDWIRVLHDKLGLFDLAPPAEDNKTLKNAKNLLTELEKLQHACSAFGADKIQLWTCDSSAAAEDRLDCLRHNIKTLESHQEKLNGFMEGINKKEKTVEKKLEQVQGQYTDTRKGLMRNHREKMAEAQAALGAADNKDHDKEIAAMQKTVDWIGDLSEQKPLSVYQAKAQENIGRLDSFIKQAKSQLRAKFSPINRAIQEHVEFVMPVLSPANPFQEDLQGSIDDCTKRATDLSKHFNQLDEISGNECSRWIDQFQLKEDMAEKAIVKRMKIHTQAEEIERRLQTPSYLVSLDIINLLNAEIKRITEKYLDPALERATDDMKKELEKVQDDFTLSTTPLSVAALNRIDARLKTLTQLRQEFQDLNASYITKNIPLTQRDGRLFILSPKQADKNYHAQLQEKVEQQLDNNHMEIYSDGKRLKLVQWLRIHLIKPLCQLKSSLSAKAFGHKSCFFVTPGATTTERTLAEEGHTAYETLKTCAPAA